MITNHKKNLCFLKL